MSNLQQLTIIQALCIIQSGWRTPVERRLYDEARSMVYNEGRRQQIDAEVAVLRFEREDLK